MYSDGGRGLICLQNVTKGFQVFGGTSALPGVCLGAQLQQDYRKWRLVRGGNITRMNFINFIDQ